MTSHAGFDACPGLERRIELPAAAAENRSSAVGGDAYREALCATTR
jgi:hypothetical protein